MCHSRTCYPLMVITVLLMGISKFNGHLEQTFLYLEIEPLNSSSTLRNIGSIPMKNYEFKFDSTPGRRQMGFFGTEVMTAFPESVEIAPKYSLPNRDRSKSATVVIDYPLVDKSVIFMHTVAAIQGLQRCYELLSELLESCQSHELNISKEVASMLALTEIGSDWLPSHSLQILREISKPRRDLTNVLIEKTLTSNEKRLDHATYKRQLREVIHLTHHYQIGNATLESNRRIDDFCLSKMNVLGNLSHSMLISGYENEIKELDIDYDVRDKGFIRSIDQIHPLVSFRIRTQQELLDEEYDRTLMNAQDEAMRNEIGLMIDVLVTELLSFFARINIAPSALFLRGLIGVFLCLAFMLTQEILRALKRHLASKLFASSELSNQRPLKVQGSSINNLRIEDLTHGSTAMRSLRDFSDNLQNSYLGKLRVPSLLLLGRSGAGT